MSGVIPTLLHMPRHSAEGTKFVCQSREIRGSHTGVEAHPSAMGCDTCW